MLERLIENWLTKTTERAFTVPFCQLLMAQGYQVKWISPHNLNEAGKDVIAEKDGEVYCFQLKDEKINLPFFLKIEPELRELLTHPIKHPSIQIDRPYKSYLVTTKEVRDPVPSRITEKNQINWGMDKPAKLEYWDIGHLLPMFVESYGAFFPSDPLTFQEEYDNFFRLFFTDGREMLPKKDFCNFYASFLPLYADKKPSKNAMATSISSLLLLTSYVLTPWVIRKNHIAQIEAWTCLQSYIYSLVNKYKLPKKYWENAITTIELQIDSLFEDFIDELKQRKHLVEGDWFTDAAVYGARVAIVLGYLSAYYFRKNVSNEEIDEDVMKLLLDYFDRYIFIQRLYGESFTPLLIYTVLIAEILKKNDKYQGLLYTLLVGIVDPNYYPKDGLPSPYYGYEETLEIRHGYKTDVGETFRGQSFFLQSLVELSARKGFRRFIETLWRKITHIQYAQFVPKDKWEYLVYRAKNGENQERFPKQEQSWAELVSTATDNHYESLPKELIDNPRFALLFGIVFPHRATPEFFRFLGNTLS